MKLTLGEAAKATGKDRGTLSRALNKGKISATKNDSNVWEIEPAELFRIYPAIADTQQRQQVQNLKSHYDNNTANVAGNNDPNREFEIKLLREKNKSLEQNVSDLQNYNDFLQRLVEKTTLLLENHGQTSNKNKKWLFFNR